MSVNKVLLLGNVGQAPVIRTTQDGRRVATFSLATSDKWKDKSSGEFREKTDWHRIVVFSDGLVGIIEKYVDKGTKLFIEGTLQTRKWTGNDGKDNFATEIILQGFNNKLEIIENRKDNTNNDERFENVEPIDSDDIPY